MNARLASLLLLLLLPMGFAAKDDVDAAPASGGTSPAVPWNVTYAGVSGSAFGSPCCIHADSVSQGQNGDCFLLSSLATLATVSPGTLKNSIVQNGDGSYNVSLFRDIGTGASPGPLYPVTITVTPEFPQWSYLWKVLKGLPDDFIYAKPGLDNSSLWTMLYEKAYAATLADGYKTYAEGSNGYLAMRQITGVDGDYWEINPTVAPVSSVRSAFVHSMPSAPDTAGHSILGGIMRGDFNAIAPDIQVCVGSKVRGAVHRVCTATCKESHSCERNLVYSVPIDSANPLVHIEVIDSGRPTGQTTVISQDESNPARCTVQSVCTYTNKNGETVTISFGVDQPGEKTAAHMITSLKQLAQALTDLQAQHRPVVFGTLAPCQSNAPNLSQNCAAPNNSIFDASITPHLTTQHEYFFRSYQTAAGDLGASLVFVGDPWSGGKQISIPLRTFLVAFRSVYSNNVRQAPAPGCGCT